jgi:hypothetical protein
LMNWYLRLYTDVLVLLDTSRNRRLNNQWEFKILA